MITKASELLKKGANGIVEAASSTQESFNQKFNQAYDLIDQVFSEIKGCKPASHLTFKDDDSEIVAKRQWVLALLENGISTLDYINRGLAMARKDTSPYFPSVGQFVKWCSLMNIADGLPMAKEAYLEAAKNSHNPKRENFSHDIVFYAGECTGWRYLLENEQKEVLPLFTRNYEILMRKLANNEPLAVELGIENKDTDTQPKKPYSKNYSLAASHLAALRDIVKG